MARPGTVFRAISCNSSRLEVLFLLIIEVFYTAASGLLLSRDAGYHAAASEERDV